MLNKMILL